MLNWYHKKGSHADSRITELTLPALFLGLLEGGMVLKCGTVGPRARDGGCGAGCGAASVSPCGF